jgi:hypothetical protein
MREGVRREKEKFLNGARPIVTEIRSTGVPTLPGIAGCLTRRGIPTRFGNTTWFQSTVRTVIAA